MHTLLKQAFILICLTYLNPAVTALLSCYKCLWSGHQASTCRRPRPCIYCQSLDHNRILCPKRNVTKKTESKPEVYFYQSPNKEDHPPAPDDSDSDEESFGLSNFGIHVNSPKTWSGQFMPTVNVPIVIDQKSTHAFLDTGAFISAISKKKKEKLGIQSTPVDLACRVLQHDVPIEALARVPVTIGKKTSVVEFAVVDDDEIGILLGRTVLRDFDLAIVRAEEVYQLHENRIIGRIDVMLSTKP